MPKKKGIKVNASSSSEADKLGKLSKKELAKSVSGTPDEWDRKNLQSLIDSYEKAFPGRLKKMQADYEVEVRLSGRNDYGEISADSGMRFGFWLPADLQQVIEAAYPTLWTEQKHAVWFIKNFPMFKGAKNL